MSVIIDGSAGITTNAGGSVNPSTNINGINFSCRAWVNFNGTGTVAIRGSGNVTSITDNGTGDYTVNMTTAMPDVDYSPYLISSGNGTSYIGNPCLFINNTTNATVAPTTSAYRVSFRDSANSSTDPTYVCTGVFR